MPQLQSLAVKTISLASMTAIACGMVTGPRVARGEIFHFNNWPADWLELYRRKAFMDIDPLPRWAIVSGAASRWSDVLAHLPPNDPGHGIVPDMEAFGFREGVVTPVRTAEGLLGLVSVGGPRTELGEQEFHFLQSICTTTLHRAEAIVRTAPPRTTPSLSRREQECVALLTQGMTEREIALRLGIREVTARFHIDNARTKTGARSRTHLAGIAGQWLGHRQR